MRASAKAKQTACINNLRQLDGAKQTWALESKAGPTPMPTIANIQPYLGRERPAPPQPVPPMQPRPLPRATLLMT